MPDLITIGLLIRNSTARQVGNFRSEAQGDLAPRLEQRGYAVRWYDEQGTSGANLSKRRVAMQMLDDLKRGDIQGIAAYDVKRLTRDEFGVDGGTIARRIVEAGGRFCAWDRDYNLRQEDDLIQFQFQCFIAGLDWRNIRNTFWSGIFKKLEQEPLYMKPPLGYMTITGADKRKHVAKNPEHAPVMDRLAELFDTCDSLAEVVRQLNSEGPARPTFYGRGGLSTRWHVYGLRYVLKNTIYGGTFSFGSKLKERSTVWDRFALAPTGKPKDFLQHRPDLAYWPPAQIRRWQRKFAKPSNSRVMTNGHAHPLLGVLECDTCGAPMIGHGANTYACPAVGSGRGRKGLVCTAPQMIVENVALQVLRREFAHAIADAQDLAARARDQLQQRKPSEAAQRLAFLEERVEGLGDQLLVAGDDPLDVIVRRIREAEPEILALRDQVAAEEDARLDDQVLARTCEVLLSSPSDALDALPPARQARVYALLFKGVRIEVLGFAAGRRWRLRRYVTRLGDDLRVTDAAPWAFYRNPRANRAPDEPKGVLQFSETLPTVVERTSGSGSSARAYASYLDSLRELAGAFSAG